MKIATLLFLSIYSLRLRAPRFLGPHDTLPCVLILATEVVMNKVHSFASISAILIEETQPLQQKLYYVMFRKKLHAMNCKQAVEQAPGLSTCAL